MLADLDAPVAAGRGLEKRYGDGAAAVNALRGVTIELAPRSFTAIMGPSGSGKSTLMHLLAGLDRPTAGEVWLGPSKLSGLDDSELTRLRRTRVGFVFQSFNLLPVLSAEQNIVLPLRISGAEIDKVWLERLLSAFGLAARRGHRPSELSGGEQQRVALARALMTRPAIIFADEPTGNLDSASTEVVLSMLRLSVQELGQTIAMVTHDPLAAAQADRLVFLRDGRIVQEAGQLSEADILDTLKALR
ncbi:MAG: ABC transporter ATP-binding protein [Solirubrobacteraceae bacterium]